jgi:hypothetical protein
MKKIMVLVMVLGLVYGASAQKTRTVAIYKPVYGYRTGVGFGLGYFSPFYSPFGYYGFPYGSYYPYGIAKSPSKLEKKEEEIRSDYADRIYSVHQDDSLTNKQKRETVRALKKQRKQEIHDLVANYHNQPPAHSN